MLTENNMRHIAGVAQYMYDNAPVYGFTDEHSRRICFMVGYLHDVGKAFCGQDLHAEMSCFLMGACDVNPMLSTIVSIHGYPDAIMRHIHESDTGAKEAALAILLNEADMMVDGEGNIVGYEKRLEDVAGRYGMESDTYRDCRAVIDIVLRFRREHGIPEPQNNLYSRSHGEC